MSARELAELKPAPSLMNPTLCLPPHGLLPQAWYLNGTSIVLAGSNYPGKCMDLPGGDARNGNQIWLWECNRGSTQQWGWDPKAQRIYYIANNKFCLDLPGGHATNGNHLQLWECNGLDSQKWWLDSKQVSQTRGVGAPATAAKSGERSVAVPWMNELMRAVHTESERATHAMQSHHGLPGRSVNRTSDAWYERPAVKEWYARQGPPRHLPRLSLQAEFSKEVEQGKVEADAFGSPHLAGIRGRVAVGGTTTLINTLNERIQASPKGDYRGGGKGVLIRAPDYLQMGGTAADRVVTAPRLNLSTSTNVVPATFLHNDIVVPSIMYPGMGGGGGNPMCPNYGNTGFSMAPNCPSDQASGEKGPWNFAQVGFVIGSGMNVMFEDYDNLQSDTWGYGVFYGSDSNSVDLRCKYFADSDGWDCPGYWLDNTGKATPYSDRHGAGAYPAGNPYVNSNNGGGAGCHFDPKYKQIDQTDAWYYNKNLVSDKHCQCNYDLKGGDTPWKAWVYQWIMHAQPKSVEGWQGWFARGKAPSFALDFTACWVNNPRDMIGIQNALYYAVMDWNNFKIPQASYDWNQPASWRNWWGWNEVPVPRTTMDDPHNWDAVIIKLPAAICGHDGKDDTLDCLSANIAYNLEYNLDKMMNQNLLKPGIQNARKRPGSAVVLLKEQRGSNAKWFRFFYCEPWKSPSGTWEVVYSQDLCYLERH